MAKKTAKTAKAAKPTKAAKPKQGSSLGEQDIRRVVEMVLEEMAERPRWTYGCYPPLKLAEHVVRRDEVLWLLDYFIMVASSTRAAAHLRDDRGWTSGCDDEDA